MGFIMIYGVYYGFYYDFMANLMGFIMILLYLLWVLLHLVASTYLGYIAYNDLLYMLIFPHPTSLSI